MSKLSTYTIKGIKKKTGIDLPKDMGADINMRLLAQAIRVYEDRKHPGLSKIKSRSEVTASKKKIYRQKGTGRARHGKISAPIFVGGGKAHGPTGVKRVLFMSKKMKEKALKMAFSLKAKEGKLVIVDGLSALKKTKDVVQMIKQIANSEKINSKTTFLFALSAKNKDTLLYLRNIKNVVTIPFDSLNAHNIYFANIIVVDKEALETKKEKAVPTKENNLSQKRKNTKSKTKIKKKVTKTVKKSEGSTKTSKKGKDKSK